MDRFAPALLLPELGIPPQARRWRVAYSGGRDSHVLLHALAALRPQLPTFTLEAIHIHHGLQADADRWAGHCAAVCAGLGVPFQVRHVDARPARGASPEAVARQARYAALREAAAQGEAVLLAHHRDDQAETLLLQLLRGAGVRGLAAMPALQAFGGGWLCRPLLPWSRAQLAAYAAHEGLAWVEDPSNADPRHDRNFLRHALMPRLQARWPAASATLARSATHLGAAARLLDARAAEDLAVTASEAGTLSVSGLLALDAERRDNLLRFWLRGQGLPLPNSARLARISEVLSARADRMPCLAWPGAEVRRYRDRLYALAPAPALSRRPRHWATPAQPLEVPGLGVLQPLVRPGAGLSRAALTAARQCTVEFRRGGERCRPAGCGHARRLKTLFQEWGVPPWTRGRVPLLFLDGALACVVGHAVCEPFAAKPGEEGVEIALCAPQGGDGH